MTHRVKDNDGFWSLPVTVAVKVNPPNQPPVAVISATPGSNVSFAPVNVTFSGAGSYDPDNINGPLAYSWDFGNGQTSVDQIAITTFAQHGTYNVTLKVTDNLGDTGTDTLPYIVKNNKPLALIDTVPPGISQVEVDTSVTFTSNGSYDPDSNQFINAYKWLVDGVNQNTNTPEISYIFNSTGLHTVSLSVFDNFGLESDLVNKTIFVVRTPPPPPPNKNPIAVINNEPGTTGNLELKTGDSYTFDGSLSYDPEDGSNVTYEWFLDGILVGTSSLLTYTFNTVGLFTLSLVVTDAQGLKSSFETNMNRRLSLPVNVVQAPKADANKLFTTGYALFGAIASGNYQPNRYGFELVDDTRKYTIIEGGENHSFFVDDQGILYGSGDNSFGQLGLPSSVTKVNTLTKIPLNSKFKVLKVSAGDTTSAIIVQDTVLNKKVLLVCGNNTFGSLGQSLPKNNIFGFQIVLERNYTNNALNFANNDNLLDVSTNQFVTAIIDNRKIWVAGKHKYISDGSTNEIGFIGLNVQQNPDLFLFANMNPFKVEVGFFTQGIIPQSDGFVTGLCFDSDNQIVWFTGKTLLRGWGYAYDISAYGNEISVILASTDPYYERAIYRYSFTQSNEIPSFIISPGVASDYYNAQSYQKISSSKFGYIALSEDYYWAWGDNTLGQLGYDSSYRDSLTYNASQGLFPGVVFPLTFIQNPTDISAGGSHSLLISSSVKPSGRSFTIIRPGGYPNPDVLTAYPVSQPAQ